MARLSWTILITPDRSNLVKEALKAVVQGSQEKPEPAEDD